MFLNIFRCILCCEEVEEDGRSYHCDVESLVRTANTTINQNPCDYQQVPHQDTYRRTFAPTLYSQSQSYSNASKFPPTPPTPSVQTRQISEKNSVPTKNSIDSQISNKNLVLIKPESTKRTTDNASEVSQKPKILLTSPSPTYLVQSKTTNPGINRTTGQKLSHNLSLLTQQSPVSFETSPSLSKPLASSFKPLPSLSGQHLLPPPPASSSSPSSFGTLPSSPKLPPFSTKKTLSLAPPNTSNYWGKTNYVWVEKGALPTFVIPEDIKALFLKDIVPGVLKKPLSPSTYKDYFDTLLNAEDYYLEKWDGFEMKDVTLELHKAEIYNRKGKYKKLNEIDEKDDKIFVAFEIDSIPERRPFLLSRDFASVRTSCRKTFQGIIYRVVKSNLVLVEFGEDFYHQHYSACKYDVKFSFNRVCLKRAHQAIAAVSQPLFRNFLFPELVRKTKLVSAQLSTNHMLDREQVSAVRQILNLQGPPPYLVEDSLPVTRRKQDKEGPLSVTRMEQKQLSRTGMVVREAVLQIYRTSPLSRILICAPLNRTCDVIMRSLQREIPESDMFRANAAFRELDGVPLEILPSCLYKGECFSCPSLQELEKFKVILSTFMSSFRLHNEGIIAGHFSHIFLVDASSATEPETMVAIGNLANERTNVVITGAPWNHSGWIRSNIARQNGLMRSYFERLRESKPYKSLDPNFITRLEHQTYGS